MRRALLCVALIAVSLGFWKAGRVNAAAEALLEQGGSTEEHFSLVGEVPEEGALGQARPGRDLRGSGLVEPPLRVEGQRRFLEPSPAVRLPSAHLSMVLVDSN